MLRKGDEISVIFIPFIFCIILLQLVAYLLGWRSLKSFHNLENMTLYFLAVVYYLFLYVLIFRQQHLSVKLAFFYGAFSATALLFAYHEPKRISEFTTTIIGVLPLFLYMPVRHLLFKHFGFSNEEYNSVSDRI